MKYTRYLNQVLKELETSTEYETDTTLVNLVRVQYLIERIAQSNSQDKHTDEVLAYPTVTAPRSAYVSAFQAELDQLRENLPPRLKLDSKSDISCLAKEITYIVDRDLSDISEYSCTATLRATNNGQRPDQLIIRDADLSLRWAYFSTRRDLPIARCADPMVR